MKNSQVIDNFLSCKGYGKGSNLYVEGNALINYTTVIAKIDSGVVYLVDHKFSRTTSKHQNQIKRECGIYALKLVLVNRKDLNNWGWE